MMLEYKKRGLRREMGSLIVFAPKGAGYEGKTTCPW